jgi:signal transduction histidine kinase
MNNQQPVNILTGRETERLAALDKYMIFNSEDEPGFKQICQLAATIFNVPIAHISFLGEHQEFVKEQVGIDPNMKLVDRKISLCALAIQEPGIKVIEDTLAEPLLQDNPFVYGDFGLRFYAAAPIVSPEQQIIGTMCLVDLKPRSLTEHEKAILGDLARVVMEQTELRLANLRLLKEKDDFIGIASHELRTPITSLQGALQVLDKLKDKPESAMIPNLISQANKSLKKLNVLVNDLLHVNRITAGRLELNKVTFTLSDMINDSFTDIRSLGEYQIILSGDLHLQVYADEARIEQVVKNMVNNAIRYAPESTVIEIHLTQADKNVRIAVTDKGKGIDPEKVPHLFDQYFRADHTGLQFSSLGLGLYISAGIVKKHGGEIGVNTALGQGSEFWFTLPM